jgi:hypothetical protein
MGVGGDDPPGNRVGPPWKAVVEPDPDLVPARLLDLAGVDPARLSVVHRARRPRAGRMVATTIAAKPSTESARPAPTAIGIYTR